MLIKYLTFLSAGRKFAIPFHDIRTVLVADNMQPIPEFPDYFAGTCLWEGQTVPVIDARKRFGFEPGEYNNRSCVIVCETNFAVREAVNAEACTRYLRGVFVDEGQTCYVVDTGMMVNDTDADKIRSETIDE